MSRNSLLELEWRLRNVAEARGNEKALKELDRALLLLGIVPTIERADMPPSVRALEIEKRLAEAEEALRQVYILLE